MDIIEELKDENEGHNDEIGSMEETVKMAISICPILQFVGDCPEKNADGKLPILDLKCWVQDGHVYYEHYTKPTSSKLLIMERSAMPGSIKRASITQMVVKILENTSQELGQKGRITNQTQSKDEVVWI